MVRTPCCEKSGLKKGPWTQEEDQKLTDYISKHGYGNWRTLPNNAGLQRCGKSCRLRWTNYLRPDIKRGRFSSEEEETIVHLHSMLGNKWSAIAARLPGRTDNEIKNYWNTHIRKKLLKMGIDPITHNPRLDLLNLSSIFRSSLYNYAHQNNLNHLNSSSQPYLNQDLLRFATSLVSAETRKNTNFLVQNSHENDVFDLSQIDRSPTEHLISYSAGFSIPFAEASEFANHQSQANDWENFRVSSNLWSNYYPVPSDEGFYQNSDFSELAMIDPTNERSLNSNSPYFTSSTEDERESYCSEGLNFENTDVFGALLNSCNGSI